MILPPQEFHIDTNDVEAMLEWMRSRGAMPRVKTGIRPVPREDPVELWKGELTLFAESGHVATWTAESDRLIEVCRLMVSKLLKFVNPCSADTSADAPS